MGFWDDVVNNIGKAFASGGYGSTGASTGGGRGVGGGGGGGSSSGGGPKAVRSAPKSTYAPPAAQVSGTVNDTPTWTDNGGGDGGWGGGGGGGGYSGPSQAELDAMARGKAQTARENASTQKVINTLLAALKGYEKGKDTKLENAQQTLENALKGIQSNYSSLLADYTETGKMNEQDESGKTASNVTNRARERSSLLEQAASMGAGETDQLRAQLQAFQNFDSNALEISRAFNDTQRQVNTQIAGANTQAETSRRNSWNTNQDQIGDTWNEYWKNLTDTWTNVQRTAAQNSNIDSDYSTGFHANTGGKDAAKEVGQYAGKTYKRENKEEKWFKNFEGRSEGRDTKTNSSNSAAAATIKAPKAAEGATLRGKW